jgi:hypothetical protein
MNYSIYRNDSLQLWRRDRMLDLVREMRACKRYGLWSAYWLTFEESASLLHMMGGMAGSW